MFVLFVSCAHRHLQIFIHQNSISGNQLPITKLYVSRRIISISDPQIVSGLYCIKFWLSLNFSKLLYTLRKNLSLFLRKVHSTFHTHIDYAEFLEHTNLCTREWNKKSQRYSIGQNIRMQQNLFLRLTQCYHYFHSIGKGLHCCDSVQGKFLRRFTNFYDFSHPRI